MPDLRITDFLGDVLVLERASHGPYITSECGAECGSELRGPKVAISPVAADEIIAWLSGEFPVVSLREHVRARLVAATRNLLQACEHVRTALIVLVRGLDNA